MVMSLSVIGVVIGTLSMDGAVAMLVASDARASPTAQSALVSSAAFSYS
jgi:hypothetical protein